MGNNLKKIITKDLSIPELAELVNGRVVGAFHEEMRITGTCAIDKYIGNKVSFVRNRKYSSMLADLRNAVILLSEDLIELSHNYPQNIYIIVSDILNSMMDVQDFFYNTSFVLSEEGISGTARIGKNVDIGNQVYIGDNVSIGTNSVIRDGTRIMQNCSILDNVVIGRRTYIYPDVTIYRNTQIGDDCLIHSGVRIGVDGFRFEQNIEQKRIRKWLHVGNVIIGNRVEIGANTAIDRAAFMGDSTVLSDDVKIDNLVHIGHNAKIGKRTLIAAQTCIGGSDKIGEDVWIGIGVTTSNGIKIGDRSKLLLNAVVAYDVAENEIVSGFYAMPHRQWKKVYKKFKEEL